MVMRLTHDQLAGQGALGQQGIGLSIKAGRRAAVESHEAAIRCPEPGVALQGRYAKSSIMEIFGLQRAPTAGE
jgi:hypothetical protein